MSPKVKELLEAHGHTGHQRMMESIRANIASANNWMRHSAVKQADEMGPASAAATSKVLALP